MVESDSPACTSADYLGSLIRHAPAWATEYTLRERSIVLMARSMGVDCSATELNDEADRFRLSRNLITAEQTRAWLKERRISATSWNLALMCAVLERKLLACSEIRKTASEALASDPDAFRRLCFMRLEVEDEGVAHELYLLLEEEGYSFYVLANRYSLERGPNAIRRIQLFCELPRQVADCVGASASRLPLTLAPFQERSLWFLYRVLSVDPAQCDEWTFTEANRLTLESWLSRFWQHAEKELCDQIGLRTI